MTNEQLYLAIGLPIFFNAMLALLLNSRIGDVRVALDKRIDDTRDVLRAEISVVRADIRLVMDKLDSMDTRLTRLEERRG